MSLKKVTNNKNRGSQCIINNIVVCMYDPKEDKPVPDKLDTFSEDVYVLNEKGLNGLACFCYKSNRWKFHTEMMEDYNNTELNIKWWWYYPPVKVSDIDR
ncbi:hypothetical protein [Jejuia spongiicola]|uniref:Uncharacterized protein n=1 Tax=Jejuia spongiicola TaxID=2942207 RepID=A0ABT0QG70_9FLAO|nr:hypothetical protein [Jejuia spongiicola]MCL6295448.1 hypothetical protein [Jejuia spongiicola]